MDMMWTSTITNVYEQSIDPARILFEIANNSMADWAPKWSENNESSDQKRALKFRAQR